MLVVSIAVIQCFRLTMFLVSMQVGENSQVTFLMFHLLAFLTGKSYDLVSFAAQEPDATVLLPTSSEAKVGACNSSWIMPWPYSICLCIYTF